MSELDDLRAAVREAAAGLGGTAVCRALPEGGPGWDAASWSVLAGQIGVAALGIPESCGGLGGLAELVVVAEECGAALLPVPFLSTVLAAQVLTEVLRRAEPEDAARAGTVAAALTGIAEGAPAAFAGLGRDGWWDPAATGFRAVPSGGGWRLGGASPAVLGAAGAEHLVVAADSGAGPDLFLVAPGAPGVEITPVPTLDLSRGRAGVVLTGTPAEPLTTAQPAAPGEAGAAVLAALDTACVVLAAEQLGGAQAALDRTVAYAGQRRQFGRAIGSFQAVKHTLADLLVQVEGARSAVDRAVTAADRAEASALAKAWCSDAYRTVSAEAVQLHGGIGFTWEHDAHLFFRRARGDAPLLGSSTLHRERLARALAW